MSNVTNVIKRESIVCFRRFGLSPMEYNWFFIMWYKQLIDLDNTKTTSV